ncbi:DUF1799 domain-containing protein [Noviherbaspirillum denitrificans]|uniref:Uncharacterized protein n=1 Tax=Noviherbaspirillum denitrificans TaxID=1968433 RepID=A0A254TDJ6_9BURK|nr:DUF1799 domain-containing protein [Noviherbaspirillum denitrificans]OWW18408.1 hypothetical protein AYR66_00990 [Noviherbaspirillum denitrificans]OWW19372.1 hypothetical protein AYR66_07475 [Noviherbaspirillum denitrificans]
MWSEGKKLRRAAALLARGKLRIPSRDGSDPEPEAEVNAAAAFFGLSPEGRLEVEEEFALWPECVENFNLWLQVQTQWRVGVNGKEGLDYGSVVAYMKDVLLVPKKKRKELFDGLRAMEAAYLDELEQAAQ